MFDLFFATFFVQKQTEMAKEQQAKKPITFILLDGSITTYGFRVLPEGVDLSQFERNPIMFYFHKDYMLPIGTWENIRRENGQILADAVLDYDDDDKEVQRIIGKIERGILKMASVGLRDAEWSDDDIYKLVKQARPTAIKSILREASIVPIGGNNNAFRLYDSDDTVVDLSDEIKLADFIKPYKQEIQMNKELLTVLNLADNANDAAVIGAIVALKDSNRLQGEANVLLQTKIDALELADKTAKKTEAETLVAKAVQDGRINDDAEKTTSKAWVKLFDNDHEGTKRILASLPARQSVVGQIDKAKGANSTELADLSAKSWDELDRSGKLITLRDKYPDVFAEKYKAEFGKEPTV